MPHHKFRTGQMATLVPIQTFERAEGRAYKILQLLPEAWGDIHVRRDAQDNWRITSDGSKVVHASYRARVYAEAYARALAYSRHVEMIVHNTGGDVVRHVRAELTYPTVLD